MVFEITGLDKFQKSMRHLSKQLDYAMSQTLNDLAFDAQDSLRKEIKGGMNTRVNTSKAFAVDKSSKSNKIAIVRLKDDWHKDAIPQHYLGGKGATIGFEYAMISRGHMRKGQSAIPLKKTGKARYKTLTQNTRRETKSNLFVASSTSKNKRTGHLKPGVYQRLKRKVKPVVLFTQEAQYKKRFDMSVTVKKVVTRRAKSYFYKNMARALRNAR